MSKEEGDTTVRARMSSKLNCKWPQPSMIVSAANRENKYIGYSKSGTPQVRECRSKVRPPQKGSKGSGKTRTSTDLYCCWPWFGIAKDSQTSWNGSEEGGSFLLIVVYLGRCSGVRAAAAKTREAALRKTRESIGRLCLRRLEIESVRQHDARDLQDGASTSYLKTAKTHIYQKNRFPRGHSTPPKPRKTYDSCAGQCGSVSFCARQDPISWSNPRPGWCCL